MKIRSGFVSNSSSSSFILFGIELKENKENNYESLCKEFCEEKELKDHIERYYKDVKSEDIEWNDIWWEVDKGNDDFDIITGDGEIWIGRTLADGDDELESGTMSLEEMNEMSKKLKKKYPERESMLHFGTYAC